MPYNAPADIGAGTDTVAAVTTVPMPHDALQIPVPAQTLLLLAR